MAKKSNDGNENLTVLKQDIDSRDFKRVYVFFGEEQYLLETYLKMLREALVPEDLAAFNHRRMSGKALPVDEIVQAVEAYPAFCEYTLTEVDDLDIGGLKEDEKNKLAAMLADMPDYAVLVFRFDTVQYKLDGRQKLDTAIKKLVFPVEFKPQQGTTLIRWISAHVKAAGHDIDRDTAEYFAFYTGGLMAVLNTEIEKVCAGAEGKLITRSDIERLVTPELSAAAFNMTDCILKNDYTGAMNILSTLYELQQEPRMIFAVTTGFIRQLYVAKLAIAGGKGSDYLMEALGIKYPYQATKIFQGARSKSDSWCSGALKLCNETAFAYNTTSGVDDKQLLTSLLLKMAVLK